MAGSQCLFSFFIFSFASPLPPLFNHWYPFFITIFGDLHTCLIALQLIDNRVIGKYISTSSRSLLAASVKSVVLALQLPPVSVGVQQTGSVVAECAPFGVVLGALASASGQGSYKTQPVLLAPWGSKVLHFDLFRRFFNHTFLHAKLLWPE